MSHHLDHDAEHTVEAIRERVSGASRQSHLKDFLFGAIDGLVTTFAVVSSVAGAGLATGIIIVMGLANLLADGFSMAAGNFTGTRAENQSARRHRREEEEEIESHPEMEREEIRQIYAAKGFSGDLLEQVVDTITSDKKRWVDTMLQEEHGLPLEPPSGLKAAIVTFVAFVTIGAIPLLAFIVDLIAGGLPQPFFISCLLTAMAFFAIGSLKSRFVDQHWFLGGAETLGIGTAAALMAYGVGFWLKDLMPEF
jgi:VIT1/CCC1 family predicted Fe2+/Mn2+ transporter